MIPSRKIREVQSGGITETGSFGISSKDSAHIMTILRDTLYSDKVMAVLREYSSNAWDAHKEVGKGDVPIKVTLPTMMDPTLSIRDYGPGLSHEDVFQVYTQYGASTKRATDQAVGMLGIGSKSGFAYSDTFTVVSRHDGMKRTYIAVLDESDIGTINLLHEEPCGEETGVLIQIAVRPDDITEFHTKAKKLFQYFLPRPDINTDLPEIPDIQADLKNGLIFDHNRYDNRGWVAIMGCVPYRVDLEQLRGMNENGLGDYVYGLSGALYFDIGEVHINASREELKYTPTTKLAIIDKVNRLVDEYVKKIFTTLEDDQNATSWQKRQRANELRYFGLPIPDKWKGWSEEWVEISGGDKFIISAKSAGIVKKIRVSSNTSLVLRDDDRAIKGFYLNYQEYLVHPYGDTSWDEVKQELGKALKDAGLDGVPISNLSDKTWVDPKPKKEKKVVNKKHLCRRFKFKPDDHYYHPWSRYWEIEKREPADNDVFVLISGFRTQGYDFYREYRADSKVLSLFGKNLPEIYGYKSTEAKPVLKENCKGLEYQSWRKNVFQELMTDSVRQVFEDDGWIHLGLQYSGYRAHNRISSDTVQQIEEMFGKDHKITAFFRNILEASIRRASVDRNTLDAVRRIADVLDLGENDLQAKEELNAITTRYPLFEESFHLEQLMGVHGDALKHYINAVDIAWP